MKKKIFSKKIILGTILIFGLGIMVAGITRGAELDYRPMENIPGTEDISTFPRYIEAIFRFAVWTIGIAALLMLIIGGYTYITSAGNTSSMEKAKEIIRDAILGVLAVILAYLLLFVINPDLVDINLNSLAPNNLSGHNIVDTNTNPNNTSNTNSN